MLHGKTRILLIEDNHEDKRVIVDLLKQVQDIPHAVDCVNNLSSALKHLTRGEHDVVLLDAALHDRTGLKAYFEIRDQALSVPVILLTGLSDENLGMEAVKKGVQDYLIKCELTGDKLSHSIRYAIERHNLQSRFDEMNRKQQNKQKKMYKQLKELYIKLDAANRQIKNELEIAKKIQQGLYPKDIPAMDGLEITADLFQARQVGGDYYDIIPVSDHEMAMLVVDVAGHDIASAFVVGMAKISFQAHIPVYSCLTDILRHVNEDMFKVVREERFLTAFLAVINTQTRTLRYAKAGHFNQCLYHSRTKELEILSTDGMFIGAFEDGNFEEKSCKMEVSDKLILFTDGLFENQNTREEEFGEKRICQSIQRYGQKNAKELHSLVLRAQKNFCEGTIPKDDMCLLVAELKVCSYHAQIKSILDTETPTLPPVLVDSKSAADEALTNILTILDKNHYSDELIRHYRKIVHFITSTFQTHSCNKYSLLRMFANIDNDSFKIVLVIQNKTNRKVDFFIAGSCREILIHFNRSFGKVDVDEDGTRVIFSYKKSAPVEEKVEGLHFETRTDGVYLTVPKNLDSMQTVESVIEELISKNVINANFSLIKEEIEKKLGEPVRIGEPFQYYNKRKNKLFKLTLHPFTASIVLLEHSLDDISLNREDLEFILLKNGIVYGIETSVLDEIVNSSQRGKEYVVARGKPAIAGEDAKLKECVQIDPTMAPLIHRDDWVDFKTLDLMETVQAGTVIIEKSPPGQGVAGRSIYGRTIDPHPGRDERLSAGKNTKIIRMDDGEKLVAETDGYLYRDRSGVHVRQLFYLTGNVDYSTGNIKYAGDVSVAGNIVAGFKVESGRNIFIQGEVEAAEIVSKKGNIDCIKGVFGKEKALISAGGNISAEFVQDARIQCGGDLKVQKSVLHIRAMVDGDITIGDKTNGLILGGEITCKGSVNTAEIGSKKQVKTVITLPRKHNEALKKRFARTSKIRNEIRSEFDFIASQLQTKAKVFKLKSKKTQREKETIEKLLEKYYELKKKVARIERIMNILKQKEQKETCYGSVVVSKAIYPNVILRFGNLEKKIISRIGPAKFVVEDEKIVMKPVR